MQLTVVIPVYNSERTIKPLVDRLQQCLQKERFDVVLVNDGSADQSESVCEQLTRHYDNVRFVSLRRNFGEFNAVLCGLTHARGKYTAIIDDDFQNPPEAILTLMDVAVEGSYDVVYSRYAQKKHHWFRNLGSWLVNTLTTYSLGKPKGLYLSSFKLIEQDVVAEIVKYTGPYPYIDGLIFRVTRNVGSVEVPHLDRVEGRSNYTVKKLVGLFLNVLIGYSLWPIRLFTVVGFSLLIVSILAGFGLLLGRLTDTLSAPGWAIISWSVWMATSLVLTFLGIVGEYIGKLFMTNSGLPPYVEKQRYGFDQRNEIHSTRSELST